MEDHIVYELSRTGRCIETERRWSVAAYKVGWAGGGVGATEVTAIGFRVSSGTMNMF